MKRSSDILPDTPPRDVMAIAERIPGSRTGARQKLCANASMREALRLFAVLGGPVCIEEPAKNEIAGVMAEVLWRLELRKGNSVYYRDRPESRRGGSLDVWNRRR